MKFYNQFSGYISQNNLTRIHPYLTGNKDAVVELSSDGQTYNCLQLLKEGKPSARMVIINNTTCSPQMVLLNHTCPVLCLEYNSGGQLESIMPIPVNKSRGINRQVFYSRYIAFLPWPEVNSNGTGILKNYDEGEHELPVKAAQDTSPSAERYSRN